MASPLDDIPVGNHVLRSVHHHRSRRHRRGGPAVSRHRVQLALRLRRIKPHHFTSSPAHVSAPFRAQAQGLVSGQLSNTTAWRSRHLVLVSCRLSSTGIGFLSILFPPEDSAFLTVGLPNRHLAARTLSGFPCSTRVRRGRGGCLLYSEAAVSSRSAQPRWSAPAASQRPALCPAGTSHRRSCSLRSIRRFTHVHPSGLPLARRPRMERERVRLLPWASHPAVTHDARQGGDGPADTGPDHTLINRTSNRHDHSRRATSRRTGHFRLAHSPARPARPCWSRRACSPSTTASRPLRWRSSLTWSTGSSLGCSSRPADANRPRIFINRRSRLRPWSESPPPGRVRRYP